MTKQILKSPEELPFLKDCAFDFFVLRFFLPGAEMSCDTGYFIGLVKLMRNENQFNVEITLPGEERVVPSVVKDRANLSNKDLWITARKLVLAQHQNIGVLIVRN